MLTTVTFEKDGVNYHIERGRKPNVLKFTVNGHAHEDKNQDESQGDSRETQKEIEDVFGMTHDMFKHLVALNTYTEPFLSMKAADQRAIIEQLLGITQLSEKAEALKEQIKNSKDSIATENTKIETIRASNDRIQQSIDSLERKAKMWTEQNEVSVTNLAIAIEKLLDIDIDQEILAHRALDAYNAKRKSINEITSWIKRCELDEVREQKEIDKLKTDIASLENHTCHSCGQGFHDDKQVALLEKKRKELQETALQALATNTQWTEHTTALQELGELGEMPTVTYDNLEQALNHKNTLGSFERDLELKAAETNPFDELGRWYCNKVNVQPSSFIFDSETN
jgi:DNA repair exonuclease SbcCD ATPase subunit